MITHISTSDGSSSLYIEELNETYHSRHGAKVESEHVFLKEGLDQLVGLDHIRVLEVGMGTGLNVLLSCNYALQRKTRIHLTTLEPFPIPAYLIAHLNYAELLDNKTASEWFSTIHQSVWEKEHQLHSNFSFQKLKCKAEAFLGSEKFDIIFYDAFGPHAQPELWELSIFQHLSKFIKPGGILVTYCAQGQFKRNLKACGFKVERLPGPPGKREMTRGVYTPSEF
ncbi:MAG: tRNA (5-methylaminomethyl-2-thiouridine)(34)-methyltransferase MnmD [Flavobacteriales bacterium]